MRRLLVVLVLLVAVAACGDDDDDATEDTFPTEVDCVIGDGDEVTSEELDEFCALEADPDTVVTFQSLECDDGGTMVFAGTDAEDPDGGSVIFASGSTSGTWRSGSYGDRYGEDCQPGGSL